MITPSEKPDKWWAWRDQDAWRSYGWVAYDCEHPPGTTGNPELTGTRAEIMAAVGKEVCYFIRIAPE